MMSVPQKYDDPYTKRLHGISVSIFASTLSLSPSVSHHTNADRDRWS